MKFLLILAALSTSTHLHMRGTAVVPNTDGVPSCGAVERLLADRFDVTLDRIDGNALVNGTHWELWNTDDGGVDLEHRASSDAITMMDMRLSSDGKKGSLLLAGALPDRTPCRDEISLRRQ